MIDTVIVVATHVVTFGSLSTGQPDHLFRPSFESFALLGKIVVALINADDPRPRTGDVVQYRLRYLKSHAKPLQSGRQRSPQIGQGSNGSIGRSAFFLQSPRGRE